MSVSVSFAGTNYLIPEEGDVPYSYLTDYLLALSSAATTNTFKQSNRIATVSPQTLQSGDAILVCNFSSTGTVNLPVAAAGTIYGVFDGSGNASANNITVQSLSLATISGQSSYKISGNFGGALFQCDGNNWVVISSVNNPVFSTALTILNDSANASFVNGSITAANAFASSNSGNTCSAVFTGSKDIEINIGLSTGEAAKLFTSYKSNVINVLSDPNEIIVLDFIGSGGIYVTKNADSDTVNFQNRRGTVLISICSLNNRIINATAWA